MPHKNETRYLPARELRIVPETDGSKTLSGYAIVFNSESVDLGGFREVVSPLALDNTLRGSPDILCLNSHDNRSVLGRSTSGTLKLSPDSTGLRFSVSLDSRSSQANDLAISVERGDVSGCSFGFRTVKDAWNKAGEKLLRTLLDIELFEISICSNPAYPSTNVSVRSCPSSLRSLIHTRSEDDEEDGECDCDCEECLEGDCADCSNPDCGDPYCRHGEDSARSVALWKLETRIAIAKRF